MWTFPISCVESYILTLSVESEIAADASPGLYILMEFCNYTEDCLSLVRH